MNWFETWFDTPYYHILYKNHDYREAETFITKLVSFLNLENGASIIDLACGKGRHSFFLNKLGYNVLGLDLSPKSIEHNKSFENDTLRFQIHDMRNPIKIEPVNAVFNLFTSFGYFDNDTDDYKVFCSVYDVLQSGGVFVLDYLNQELVRNNIEDFSVVEKEGISFNIHKKIEGNFIIKSIHFEDKGRTFNYYEKVKLHTPESILNYAEKVGFERIKIWGNYDLSDFDAKKSPRCINLFRKK